MSEEHKEFLGKEFRVNNGKVAANLLLGVAGVAFFAYLAVKLIILMVTKTETLFGEISIYEIPVHIVVFLLGFFIVLLFAFMCITFVLMSQAYYNLFYTSIAVSDLGIEIKSTRRICFILNENIMYIFKHSTRLTFVWRVNGSPVTFFVTNYLFGKKEVSTLASLLSKFDIYVEDEMRAKEIRKKLKLDHIFRTNRYEYQLSKQRNAAQ